MKLVNDSQALPFRKGDIYEGKTISQAICLGPIPPNEQQSQSGELLEWELSFC